MVERRPLTATDKPMVSTNGSGEIAQPNSAAVRPPRRNRAPGLELSSDMTSSTWQSLSAATGLRRHRRRRIPQVRGGKGARPDPIPDPVAARNTAESAAFMANRLKTMQPRLAAHFEKVYAAEQVAHYLAKLGQLAPERDALAQELHDTYPAATAQLTDLFSRVRSFEQRARQQLGNPPANCEVLERIDVSVVDKVTLPDSNHPDRTLAAAIEFRRRLCAGHGHSTASGRGLVDPEFQARRAAERAAENERLARIAQARAAEQLERENPAS